jgi:hypothetical protein
MSIDVLSVPDSERTLSDDDGLGSDADSVPGQLAPALSPPLDDDDGAGGVSVMQPRHVASRSSPHRESRAASPWPPPPASDVDDVAPGSSAGAAAPSAAASVPAAPAAPVEITTLAHCLGDSGELVNAGAALSLFAANVRDAQTTSRRSFAVEVLRKSDGAIRQK